MIEHVPARLWAVVLGVAVVCAAAALALVVRGTRVRAGAPVQWAWIALVIVAAAALIWDALYSAALSTIHFGALIPIFHWLFTFAPAVLAGCLFIRRGRRERWTAALSTGVVTVPLLALSFALLGKPGPSVAELVPTLILTSVLGIAPLVGGVAVAGAVGTSPVVTGGRVRS